MTLLIKVKWPLMDAEADGCDLGIGEIVVSCKAATLCSHQKAKVP